MPELAVSIAPGADLADPLSWVFEDISTSLRTADGVTINYGRRDEGSLVDTTNVTLRLDNRDGRFVRLNPLSPLYKRIRTGTPIRITITGGTPRLLLPGDGARATAAHQASHDLAGNLDFRIEYDPAVPEPVIPGVFAVAQALVRRWHPSTTVGQAWMLNHHGQTDTTFGGEGMRFRWRDSGGASQLAESGPYALGGWNGRRAMRVTLELNVAGSHRITWYSAATIVGPWRQFAQETRAGVTSIQASSEPFALGACADGSVGLTSGVPTANLTFQGSVRAMELRDGIDGTLVASPDFMTAALGTGGFADAQGNTWTPAGGGSYSDAYELFQGFVAEWPTRWDRSGRDSTVPISAVGQLRRLQRRDRQAAKSVVHRMVLANLRDG